MIDVEKLANTSLELPAIPSELIRVAIADLTVIEADPRYRVDMSHWHKANGQCAVCLAGAVIANRINDPTVTLAPSSFPIETMQRLTALDLFRAGYMKEGVRKMGLDWSMTDDEPPFMCVDAYREPNSVFKEDMLRMADHLQSKGF